MRADRIADLQPRKTMLLKFAASQGCLSWQIGPLAVGSALISFDGSVSEAAGDVKRIVG